jgi:NADH-quinone oxidoreductase E subunit
MAVSQVTQDVYKGIPEPKDALVNRVNEILESYQGEKADLIPILQEVQQKLGYLSEVGLKQIARYINIPESTVFGVVTFYAQFKLVPTGRNIIRVCRGTGCYVRGAPRILDVLENELGIKAGETTPDLEYTLETVACFGSCALAPVIVVNDRVYGRVTTDKVKSILSKKEGA